MTIIPVFPDESPKWRQQMSLGEKTYELYFYWNTRQASWYMSIREGDGAPIVEGIRVVAEQLLLDGYKSRERLLPEGDLLLVDQQNPPKNGIGFSELGKRYILVYLSEEELP